MVASFRKKANRDFFNEELLFKTVGILFIVFVLVLTFIDFKMYQKKRELTLEINNYQQQVENIQKSSQTLKNDIANSDNVDYLEKLGYEQFNETRPGETEYMFIHSQNKAKPVEQAQNFWDIKTWTGWLSGDWQWIKSKF